MGIVGNNQKLWFSHFVFHHNFWSFLPELLVFQFVLTFWEQAVLPELVLRRPEVVVFPIALPPEVTTTSGFPIGFPPEVVVFPLVSTRSCGLRHGPEITTTSGFPNCASTTSSGGTPQDENGFCVLRTSHSRSHYRSHAFGNIMCVLTDSRDRGNAKVFLRIHRGLHGRAHFLLCLYYGISSNPHYTRAVLWVSSTFLVFSSTFLLRFTNEILQF